MRIRKLFFSILMLSAVHFLGTASVYAQLRGYTNAFNKKGSEDKYYYKGLTLSYSYTTPFNVSLKHYFSGFNSSGQLVEERNSFHTVEAKSAYYGNISTYFPMIYTSEKSMVALDFGLEAMGFVGSVYNVTADDGYTYDADFAQMNAGAHVGVSYKYGGLASYAKQDKFSWFAGAGITPGIALANYGDIIQHNKFNIVPVFNAGIGLFAGVQWTIIGKYYPLGFGNDMVLGHNLKGMDTFPSSSRITYKTEPFFQVGVGVNLFSINWETYRW